MHHALVSPLHAALCPAQTLHVGIDTVCISRVEQSLRDFGERFVTRLFTPHEAEVAAAQPPRRAERLAARFAAKEATLKALDLCEAGIDWRHIEVQNDASGRPRLALHGKAAAHAHALGDPQIALSLSHDGDQACAVVVGLVANAPAPRPAADTTPQPAP